MSCVEFAQKRQERTDETDESRYTGAKPSGPVLENTTSTAFATPNDMRGFVMPKISGMVRFVAPSQMFTGEMGLPARMAARLLTCFQHLVHPSCLKTCRVGFLSPTGTKPMSVITQRTFAPTPSKQDAIPASNLHAVLAAFNAANLASSYIERGNFAAARRKLTQALSAINTLQAEA
ncbi:hypothetical protein H9K76_15410 [Diaphorobacter ruginosibacter]|uniref:Uncharacterized protein n=1 Tax=Diaphorobacter ruginosibacter TaxID=1715720 RepID=A0A7G9RK46_9BURK|nr:hypothetical protein [Diaphorobacter ruginosibacter]QNN55971.1 hypothetical protein H9K76_15410 [Diaphorobacter ruginosibacter]